jgi:hypothetical protein
MRAPINRSFLNQSHLSPVGFHVEPDKLTHSSSWRESIFHRAARHASNRSSRPKEKHSGFGSRPPRGINQAAPLRLALDPVDPREFSRKRRVGRSKRASRSEGAATTSTTTPVARCLFTDDVAVVPSRSHATETLYEDEADEDDEEARGRTAKRQRNHG